jgi:hypothetical protein
MLIFEIEKILNINPPIAFRLQKMMMMMTMIMMTMASGPFDN